MGAHPSRVQDVCEIAGLEVSLHDGVSVMQPAEEFMELAMVNKIFSLAAVVAKMKDNAGNVIYNVDGIRQFQNASDVRDANGTALFRVHKTGFTEWTMKTYAGPVYPGQEPCKKEKNADGPLYEKAKFSFTVSKTFSYSLIKGPDEKELVFYGHITKKYAELFLIAPGQEPTPEVIATAPIVGIMDINHMPKDDDGWRRLTHYIKVCKGMDPAVLFACAIGMTADNKGGAAGAGAGAGAF